MFTDSCGRSERLTAAANTAARAAHDFDKLVICFSGTNLVHQYTGIFQTVGNGNLNRCSIQVEGRFFNALMTAASGEIQAFRLFAGDYLVYCTDSRFHNAAGGAEDSACAGAQS